MFFVIVQWMLDRTKPNNDQQDHCSKYSKQWKTNSWPLDRNHCQCHAPKCWGFSSPSFLDRLYSSPASSFPENSTRWSWTSTDLRAHGNLNWYLSPPNQFFSENVTCTPIILVPMLRGLYTTDRNVSRTHGRDHFGPALSRTGRLKSSEVSSSRMAQVMQLCQTFVGCLVRWSLFAKTRCTAIWVIQAPLSCRYHYGVISSTIQVGSAFRQFEGFIDLPITDHYHPWTFGLSSLIMLKRAKDAMFLEILFDFFGSSTSDTINNPTTLVKTYVYTSLFLLYPSCALPHIDMNGRRRKAWDDTS